MNFQLFARSDESQQGLCHRGELPQDEQKLKVEMSKKNPTSVIYVLTAHFFLGGSAMEMNTNGV